MSIQAKKKFGQNFLQDDVILQKIDKQIDTFIQSQKPSRIIEIGPGTGQLTKFLVRKDIPFTALEIDKEAFDYLATIPEMIGVDIRLLDALEESETADGIFESSYFLVSNLPFNVGSRILVNLGVINPINSPFIVILQKEVASKALKTSDFTLFGAWLNLFWDTKIAFDIPRNSYVPAPDVATSLLIGNPKAIEDSLSTVELRKKALKLLKLLTAHPRKTVKANLKYAGFDAIKIQGVFDIHHWNDSLRLTWENYEEIVIKLLAV